MSERTTISLSSRAPHKDFGSGIAGSIPLSLPALLSSNTSRAKRLNLKLHRDERGTIFNPNSVAKEQAVVGGKRRRQRLLNAQFTGNPHLVRPLLSDYQPLPVVVQFFAPPPPKALFPRSCVVGPATGPSPSNPVDDHNGQYSRSARGIRRELRDSHRAMDIVKLVEHELVAWLENGYPLLPSASGRIIDATLVADLVPSPAIVATAVDPLQSAIVEAARSTGALVWIIADAYTRFVVHSLARHYSLISVTKPTRMSGGEERRMTHILRPQADPNVLRLHPGMTRSTTREFSSAAEESTADDFTSEGDYATGETTGDDDSEAADQLSELDEEEEGEQEDAQTEQSEQAHSAADPTAAQVEVDTFELDLYATASDHEELTSEDDEEQDDQESSASDMENSGLLPTLSTSLRTSFFATASPGIAATPRPARSSLIDDPEGTPRGSSTPTRVAARQISATPTARAASSPLALALATASPPSMTSTTPTGRPSRLHHHHRTPVVHQGEYSDESRSPSRSRVSLPSPPPPAPPIAATNAPTLPAIAAIIGNAATTRRRGKNGVVGWQFPKRTFANYLFASS